MKQRLIPEWKRVLRYAWSLRLMLAAALLSGAELVLPLFQDAIPRKTFAALLFALTVGAAVARFVTQNKVRGD